MNKIIILCVSIILLSSLIIYGSYNLNKPTPATQESKPAGIYQKQAIESLACFHNQEALPEQIWLLSKVYSQTKDNKYLDVIKAKIDQLPASSDSISPLRCKMFSEVVQVSVLDQNYSQKIKNNCLNSSDTSSSYDLIQKLEKNYKPNELNSLVQKSSSFSQTSNDDPDKSMNIKILSLLSSENIGIYKFTNNSAALKSSQILFQHAYSVFIKKRNWEYVDACTLGSAALDNYFNTNNKTYLNAADFIFNKAKTITEINNINLFSKGSCTNFFTRYFDLTSNLEASKVNKFLIKDSLDFNYDDLGTANYHSASKCFINFDNTTPFFENSLIISSLLDIK